MKATITTNTEHNGIEIAFDSKPSRETLEAIKAQGFRWHNAKKIWYAKNTADRLAAVSAICDGAEATPAAAAKSEKANKYGVKVGDIFRATWGWEQTNNDFFQVVALCGESSVRVREVCLPLVESTAISGMSEDRTFSIDHSMLPAVKNSVFIKDQERGDIKRLKSYSADGLSNPQFNLTSYANAYYCAGDKVTVYESWYA